MRSLPPIPLLEIDPFLLDFAHPVFAEVSLNARNINDPVLETRYLELYASGENWTAQRSVQRRWKLSSSTGM